MRFVFFVIALFISFGVRASPDLTVKTRYPVAAGLYYPRKPEELKKKINDLLDSAQGRLRYDGSELPKVILVPHGTLYFSGDVAAAGYAALRRLKPFVRRVVLISSSQHGQYFGVSLSSARFWAIPGQQFKTDQKLIEKLRKIQGVDFDDAAHEAEEALEVQLPFIGAVFRPDVKIVPILVEDASTEQIADLIDLIWGGPETVIIIATNLSQGTAYEKVRAKDFKTAQLLEKKEDITLKKDQISAPLPVEGLLAYVREIRASVKTLDLRTSADILIPDREIVGFGAFGVYENTTGSETGKEETEELLRVHQEDLLRIAAQSIVSGFERGRALRVRESRYPEELSQKGATFVSIYLNGALRGNAGSTEPARSILDDIAENAYTAAFLDFRFNPLTQEELKEAEISISLLTRRTPIKFTDEADLLTKIRPATDGLVLRERSNKALFLPQIWETFSSPKEFLSHLKRKAGLPMEYWSPTVKVYRFEVIDISSGDLENPASIWEPR